MYSYTNPYNIKFYKRHRLFVLILLICGYNYFPVLKRSWRIFINLYCIFLSAVNLYFIHVLNIRFGNFTLILTGVELFLVHICHIFGQNRLANELFKNLDTIDAPLGLNSNASFKTIRIILPVFLYMFGTSILEISLVFGLAKGEVGHYGHIKFFNSLLLVIQTSFVPKLLILYCNRIRMQGLQKVVGRSTESDLTEENIKKQRNIYRNLLNYMDEVSDAYDNLGAISTIICSCRLLLVFRKTMVLVSSGEGVIPLLVLGVLHNFTLLCVTGIMAELIAKQVDAMKNSLFDKLRICPDERSKVLIKEFLRYIRLRPFKMRIWKIIPVDVTLPANLAAYCATYFIVIAQFIEL